MAYIRGRRGLRLVFNMLQQRVVGQRVITERSQHKARTFKKSQIVMFYFVSTIKSINIAYTISLHSTAYSHILNNSYNTTTATNNRYIFLPITYIGI